MLRAYDKATGKALGRCLYADGSDRHADDIHG